MKYLLMFFFYSFFTFSIYAQKQNDALVQIDIVGDNNVFMCPFLSPRYVEILKKHYVGDVWKSEDLVIHIKCKKELKPSYEDLYKDAETIGYQRDYIHISEKNIEIKE